MKKIFAFVSVVAMMATTAACGGGKEEKAAAEAIDSIAAVDSVAEAQEAVPEQPAGLLMTREGIGELTFKTAVKDYPEKVDGLYDKLTYKVEENEMDGDSYYYQGTLDGKKSVTFGVQGKNSKPSSMDAMKGTNILVELDGKQVSPWEVTAQDLLGLGGKPVYEWGTDPYIVIGKVYFMFAVSDLVSSAQYKNESGEKLKASDFKGGVTPRAVSINTWS